jgi:hypothetical protein
MDTLYILRCRGTKSRFLMLRSKTPNTFAIANLKGEILVEHSLARLDEWRALNRGIWDYKRPEEHRFRLL